jgi:hypothetical protein
MAKTISAYEYEVQFQCINCQHRVTAAIRKGMTVDRALKKAPPCSRCGCSGTWEQCAVEHHMQFDQPSAVGNVAESSGNNQSQS